jgi:hypothetical protein
VLLSVLLLNDDDWIKVLLLAVLDEELIELLELDERLDGELLEVLLSLDSDDGLEAVLVEEELLVLLSELKLEELLAVEALESLE